MKRTFESTTEEAQNVDSLHIASIEPIPSHAAAGVQLANLHLQKLELNTVDERVQSLRLISQQINLLNVEQQKIIVETLISLLEKEIDSDTKAMVILVVEKCSRFPNINASEILKYMLNELNSDSTEVKWHVYNCIYSILKYRQVTQEQDSQNILESLYKSLTMDLSNLHHKVRAISISLLSLLPFVYDTFTVEKPGIMTQMEIQKIISNYTRDSDPRVRKSALDALVQMHLRGCPLDLSIYSLSVISLRDDHEEVRMGGLNLLGVLSSLYPEHRMKLAHEEVDETTRLIDDAFNKVCDLVNDSAVTVRTKACVMMASYQHVGSDTLNQTFSKQIMSHLKRTIPRYKQQQKKYIQGTIPVAEGDIDVESNEFHLLDSGACGSFIHGLEDEFQEVRNASIDSICELSMYNEELTKKAVEFLVDMFNDDIDRIRLNAIQSLRKIGTRCTLEFDEEQLEIAVGALEDSDPLARHATHDLFTVVRLTCQISLNTLLNALHANMKRYPIDILSIYRCLSDVGKKHEDYIETLVPSLLKLDKRYLPKEANVEDQMYTAYVILIINACTSNPKILINLPKYIFRHFAYFKSKYPDCIPDLRKLYKTADIKLEGDVDCLPITFSSSAKKLVAADAENYMTATTEMLHVIKSQVERKELDTASMTLDVALRNFKYITSLKPVLAGKSELAQLYLRCYGSVIKIKQSHSSPTYASTAQMAAASLLRNSYAMQHTFLGLSKGTLHAAMYIRVIANMIWMFGVLKQIPISKSTSFNIKNMLLAFHQRVSSIQSCFNDDDDAKASKENQILIDLKKNLLSASDSPTTSKISTLYPFITSFLPLDIHLDNPFKRTTADITQPIANPDKPYKFSSQFPIKLHIEADISNSSNVNALAVEFILPDQSSYIFWPAPTHFKQTTPYCFKLSTDVELELSPWTEPGVVIVRIVQSFEPDLPDLDEYIMSYPNTSLLMNPSNSISKKSVSSSVISEHLKYRLCPSTKMSKRSLESDHSEQVSKRPDNNKVTNSFHVKRNEEYEGSFPVYKQPQEINSYSIDHERRVWFDNREMKYYYPPTGKNLNYGYEELIQRDESIPEHLDTLLDSLTDLRSKTEDLDKSSADIVTWRGIMTKILCTPYSRKEAWEIRASRYNGTIYMEEQKQAQENESSDKQKLMCYWGYRFETLSTLSKPPHKVTKGDIELQQRLKDSANTNIQYCILVKTKLGNNSIIMGAEVDCCRDVKPTDPLAQPSNYIELKTSRKIETSRNQYSFDRYKLLKFWAQSFLVGVPRVICGFRDDDGQILDVVQYKTMEIPRQVREKPNTWNPSVCLNFANELLDWIKLSVTKDDPTVTYSIQFKYPFKEITIECTGHSHVFLTQRYLNGDIQHEIGGPRADCIEE